MPEDNQQEQQSTVAELHEIAVNAMKSQYCLLIPFIGIPHDYDLTYKEDSEQLMVSVKNSILNDHYLMIYKTLKQYVFKEKYTGEESRHQSMCPFHLLSLICRCNKHYNVVPMLLSQSPP